MPAPRISAVFFLRGEPAIFADVRFFDGETPEDYSEYTFTAQWRPSSTSEEFIQLTIDQAEAEVGHIVVTASSDETRQMSRLGVWDVQGSIGANEPRTFLAGSALAVADVTR